MTSVDLADVARAALTARVDECRKAFGAVAALVEPGGVRFVAHGRTAHDSTCPVDADTVFDAGCLMYVFDALLLADMAERGEVEMTDRVERYLPPDVTVPQRGRSITLQDLAAHTSGLPGRRLDGDTAERIDSVAGLYRFLSAYTLPREVGLHYECSKTGAVLLRHVLSRHRGTEYETLLRTRIWDKLQMASTAITPTPEMRRRLAAGHNDRLEPLPFDPTELRSTARDLAVFLQACLGHVHSPLDSAIATLLTCRSPCGPNVEATLGWEIETNGGDDIVCRNGDSLGFRAWMGFRPRARRGVAVLSNALTVGGFLDIGFHLLDSSYPLLAADTPFMRASNTPRATTVADATLEAHVGRYQLTPNVVILVTRQGSQLFAEKAGTGKVPIFPESPVQFFCKDVDFHELPADTRIVFRRAADGSTIGMTLHQRGQDTWLPRVEHHRHSIWFGHTPAAIDGTRLRKYVGRYRLGSTVGGYRLGTSVISITLESDELIAAFDEWLRVPLAAKSETEFFVENDVCNLHFRFEMDASGRATGLVGTYDGIPRRGVRIDEDCTLPDAP